jgi:predicted membrane protein
LNLIPEFKKQFGAFLFYFSFFFFRSPLQLEGFFIALSSWKFSSSSFINNFFFFFTVLTISYSLDSCWPFIFLKILLIFLNPECTIQQFKSLENRVHSESLEETNQPIEFLKGYQSTKVNKTKLEASQLEGLIYNCFLK